MFLLIPRLFLCTVSLYKTIPVLQTVNFSYNVLCPVHRTIPKQMDLMQDYSCRWLYFAMLNCLVKYLEVRMRLISSSTMLPKTILQKLILVKWTGDCSMTSKSTLYSNSTTKTILWCYCGVQNYFCTMEQYYYYRPFYPIYKTILIQQMEMQDYSCL